MNDREIQYREKQELKRPEETTKSGLTFVPAVDIFATAEALTLVADMPGVTSEGLVLDLKDDQITITGQTQDPTGPRERFLLKEYETGQYYRQFALPEVIDQGKISAQLKNGVLTLVLPKVEKAKPRRIEIKVD
jgi:HSP20 family protein